MTAVTLSFRPPLHGFHFPNAFTSHFAGGFPPVHVGGLCGGMVLGAFNYFRYGLPIPPHTDAEIDFDVNFEILRTLPGTSDVVDYVFHSQVATFENISILAFIGPADPSFTDEFRKVKARIDRGEYSILGLKMRHGVGGFGHQVLCYGYDPDTQAAIVYDPNFPDREVQITAARSGNDSVVVLRTDAGQTDPRFRAIFEQQELFPSRISDRVTYDAPDNVARNLNFAVRPPLVNVQDGWRWCARCEGMWFALNPTAGTCPAGGGHVQSGSGSYLLPMNYRQSSGQEHWYWCRKCEGLFYGGGQRSGGVCFAGGEHDGSASADYTVVTPAVGNAGFTQDGWRRCNRCQGMHFARAGVCATRGAHDASRGDEYVMPHT